MAEFRKTSHERAEEKKQIHALRVARSEAERKNRWDISDGCAFCSGCEKRVPLSEFNTNPKTPNGYQSRCKTCEADRKNLRKMFGVAISDVPENFYKLNCQRLALVRETKIAKKEIGK